MPNKPPAFQFYPKDFLTDPNFLMMDSVTRGIFITLYCIDWLEDGIHVDDMLMVGGCSTNDQQERNRIQQLLNRAFIAHPHKSDFVTHPLLIDQRVRQETNRKNKSHAGQVSQTRRKQAISEQPPALVDSCSNRTSTESNSPSPSSTASSSSIKNDVLSISREPNEPNSVPYGQIVALFHGKCTGLPRIRKLTPARQQVIKARFSEYGPVLDDFEAVFTTAAASDFLSGRNGRFHGCGFDWLLKQANFIKVLEGNYSRNDSDRSHPVENFNPENRESGVYKTL